ncbi:hypothetical protein OsJ_06265 [Oryza sativa Japonica Group]|jgi:hypothetical protein|uniref:Uncharacterized protein n=1 Tax=Oryza sativa subsp. japonica TaxID=39947 RepID=Q6K3C5_ORYSJ|nr:hypothetical protein OsJ_06265 [Oryza sativa Japonica Group]BAD22415.1 hypothetical protein [Oryza sativa Japonica Group]
MCGISLGEPSISSTRPPLQVGRHKKVPKFPDKTTVLGSLGTLIGKLEATVSKHAAQAAKEMHTDRWTSTCDVLVCIKLTHPEINLEEVLSKSGAEKTHEGIKYFPESELSVGGESERDRGWRSKRARWTMMVLR